MKKLFIPFFLFLLTAVGLAYTSPGRPSGHVNDFAGILPSATRQTLESDLRRHSAETHHEIAVVTIKSLGGDTIENYANQLFREWGIGSQQHNNGVLFLIAAEDRKMRIEVGYGLEGALTDLETQYIQEEAVKPHFKGGDYPAGIHAGVQQIKQAIAGEIIKEKPKQDLGRKLTYWLTNPWVIIGCMTFLLCFVCAAAPTKDWAFGGTLGGVVGLMSYSVISEHAVIITLPLGMAAGWGLDYAISTNPAVRALYRRGAALAGGILGGSIGLLTGFLVQFPWLWTFWFTLGGTLLGALISFVADREACKPPGRWHSRRSSDRDSTWVGGSSSDSGSSSSDSFSGFGGGSSGGGGSSSSW